MKFDIQVYGQIYSDQSNFASEMGIVSLMSIKKQLDNMPQGTTDLVVHINSPGGEVTEGFAIHNLLVETGKNVTTIIEGLCASIATIVALAGSTRKITENSEFMIHNPWGQITGTAEEVQQYADYLLQKEEEIAAFYVKKTGADLKMIQKMMDKESHLTTAQALEMKFVTEIVSTVKAVAQINKPILSNIQMTKLEETLKQIGETLKAMLPKVKALCLKTVDNKFDLNINTKEDQPKLEDEVSVDGKPVADGEYELPEGKILVCKGGKITEIKIKEVVNPDNTDDATALKEKNKALEAKVADLEKQVSTHKETEKGVEARLKDFETLLGKLSSTYNVVTDPANTVTGAGVGKGKGEEDKGSSVLQRKKELDAKAAEKKKAAAAV